MVPMMIPYRGDTGRPGKKKRVLHDRGNILRVEGEAGTVPLDDPWPAAGVPPVRLAHLPELREAFDEAFSAAGRPAPR